MLEKSEYVSSTRRDLFNKNVFVKELNKNPAKQVLWGPKHVLFCINELSRIGFKSPNPLV